MPSENQSKRLLGYSLAALGLVVLVVIGALLLANTQYQANRMVLHTVTVERELIEGLERIRALESAQRGYVITGDPYLLRQYAEARDGARTSIKRIHALTLDNPRQTRNLEQLKDTLERRTELTDRVVALRNSGSEAAVSALLKESDGVALTSKLATRIEAMIAIERGLFQERTSRARELSGLLTIGQVVAMLLMMMLAGLIVTDFRRRAAMLSEALAGREAAESRLRHLQKMESIGQLTGGIAHDFNNMLAIVIGSLDMADRRIESDPAKAHKCIGDARSGAEMAAQLTSRLLAFSRQQPLSPKPIDVNVLVERMHELLARTLGEHIVIEPALGAGVWGCFVDPPQLESAILNLAVNARDAMPDGGVLMIETANVTLTEDYAAHRQDVTPGDYVMISFSDTGEGMDQTVIERAFDPFFTTKEVGKGTGLGLSQVYGYIKQSGGHVALYSERGRGTVVKIYLPRHEAGEPRLETLAKAVTDPLPGARGHEKILLVEDEERLRHFSVEALTEMGYVVISAPDGLEALALLEGNRDVSLLFTDVVMPGISGRELAERACEIVPDLKILYTTGYTRNGVVHNGILDEGVDLLSKPFTLSQLATRVRAAIDVGDECET